MPKMTPQAAQWRINYARKHGKEPDPADLELAQQVRQSSIEYKHQSPQSQTQSSSKNQPNKIPVGNAVPGVSAPSTKLTPRARDWQDFTAKNLGPLMILALVIFTGDWDKAAFYAFTPEECKALAPHVAKIAPKIEDYLHVPKVVHDAIVNADDTVALLSIMLGYLTRIGVMDRILPQVVRVIRTERKQNEQSARDTEKVPTSGSNGYRQSYNSADQEGHVDISRVPGLGGQYNSES